MGWLVFNYYECCLSVVMMFVLVAVMVGGLVGWLRCFVIFVVCCCVLGVGVFGGWVLVGWLLLGVAFVWWVDGVLVFLWVGDVLIVYLLFVICVVLLFSFGCGIGVRYVGWWFLFGLLFVVTLVGCVVFAASWLGVGGFVVGLF